jgi:hypothetical protein
MNDYITRWVRDTKICIAYAESSPRTGDTVTVFEHQIILPLQREEFIEQHQQLLRESWRLPRAKVSLPVETPVVEIDHLNYRRSRLNVEARVASVLRLCGLKATPKRVDFISTVFEFVWGL